MSAYYPVVLTGASLIVCFWAEVFHLREVRWDRPRFLSKVRVLTLDSMKQTLMGKKVTFKQTLLQSFLGFLMFNVITYTLMVAQMCVVWFTDYERDREFYR